MEALEDVALDFAVVGLGALVVERTADRDDGAMVDEDVDLGDVTLVEATLDVDVLCVKTELTTKFADVKEADVRLAAEREEDALETECELAAVVELVTD